MASEVNSLQNILLLLLFLACPNNSKEISDRFWEHFKDKWYQFDWK